MQLKGTAMSSSIHESASIGSNTRYGEFCVIGANVRIGSDCAIGNHVVIHADTVVGDNVRIDDHAVLGKTPMRSAAIAIPQGENLSPLILADRVLVGTGATLYRGAQIGTDCLVADYASVREESTVGESTIIGRGTVIENRVTVGSRCKVETGVFISAFSSIGNDCFIAPHVSATNDNYLGRTEERKKHFKGITIENGGRIGANAILLPGLTVETEGVAAAGAVVTRNIPAKKIVAGIPARPLRDVPSDQLLENQ
jgi:UDP-2-acetamido-3-amino-2,3-dideoxy-glucuronate N-acetyltransferase